MASAVVPMLAGQVVKKIGQNQGWDPKVTGVLGAAAAFGAGGLMGAAMPSAATSAVESNFAVNKVMQGKENLNMFGAVSPLGPDKGGMLAKLHAGNNMEAYIPSTGDRLGKFWNKATTTPKGKKTSPLGEIGAELAATMAESYFDEEAPPSHQGGGGGGGPMMAPYQGGGAGQNPHKVVWNFGQGNGYKPQGI